METRDGRRKADRREVAPLDLPSYADLEGMTPRALLKRLGLRARKGFSQNFLTDQYVVSDIIAAAELAPLDQVLEIGPGLGVLTRDLVRVAGRVVAVELDRQLADLLPRMVPDPSKLEVIQGDILETQPEELFNGDYKVVANLPYAITSPALRHLLTAAHKPSVMVVMVQREVAERIAAKPGNTSLMSIMVQLYSRVTIVRHVEATAFFPAPEVESTVLKLEVYSHLPLAAEDPEGFLSLVASGFSRRRKQIHNSLSEATWFPPGGVFQVLEASGIDPTRRAQTLSLEEWDALFRNYSEFKGRWKNEGVQ